MTENTTEVFPMPITVLDTGVTCTAARLASPAPGLATEAPSEAISVWEWCGETARARELRGYHETVGFLARLSRFVERDPLGVMPIADVQPLDLKAWIARMYARRAERSGKPLSAQTIRNVWYGLRAAFQEAEDRGAIALNPTHAVKLARSVLKLRPSAEGTALTPDEMRAFFQHASIEIACFVSFAVETGLRLSELNLLHLADVHLDGSAPYVFVRYGSYGPNGEPRGPKYGRTRNVPLSANAVNVARVWLAHLKSTGAPNFDRVLFPDRTGRRRAKGHPPGGRWEFRETLVRAGIKRRVRVHDLRHTAGTGRLNGWFGEALSQPLTGRMLGHRDQASTARYAKPLEATLFRAIHKPAKS